MDPYADSISSAGLRSVSGMSSRPGGENRCASAKNILEFSMI